MTLPRTLALLVASLLAARARAETTEIRCAQQYGLTYLALMMMEDGHLVERHAERLGLRDVRVTWSKLGGPGPMNDALLSGSLDFASGGIPSLILLWSRTQGGPLEVRGVGALNDMPVELVTSNPKVRTVKDFGPGDRIALPTVKISTQALLLEMAAARAFGDASFERLDPLTVSVSHPDAMAALLAGTVSAHFSSPPFLGQERARPGVHLVLSNYELLGGQATFTAVWTTMRFKKENPLAFQAFAAALEEATEAIRRDKAAAAAVYKRMSATSESVDDLVRQLSDPKVEFTLTPHRTLVTAEFMHHIKRIKVKPRRWTDLFFENLHGRDGS